LNSFFGKIIMLCIPGGKGRRKLQFGYWGGRYGVPYDQTYNMYGSDKIIHHLSTENMC